jgi:hypothetical protein
MPERIREKVDYHIPRITTYEEWKTMALEMDGIWRSIQGERTFAAPKPTTKPGTRPLPKVPFNGIAPKAEVTTGRGAPMEIGWAQAQKLCYNCREPGHFAKDCPKPPARPQQVRKVLIDPETMSEDQYKLVIGRWEQRQKESDRLKNLDLGQWKESEIAALKAKLAGF